MIYEYYRDGRLVERQEPLDQPGDAGETAIQLKVLARREAGQRDGWYCEGDWAAAEDERAAAEKTRKRASSKTPTTTDGQE